jgi:hypothetical protein
MRVFPWQPEGAHLAQAAVLQHMAQVTVNTRAVFGQQLYGLGLGQNVVDINVVAILWLLAGCP